MMLLRNTALIFLGAVVATAASNQRTEAFAENAALRYWAAFSEIRDTGITGRQGKELSAILDGTAPYDDAKYGELVKKNELALRIMSRGVSLPGCDWGLDYELGSNMPVEYARKALVLGRLNVLYALHLRKTGNKEGAVHALVAGLRFSHDVANGGSLFPTLVANSLLTDHLRAIAGTVRSGNVNTVQRNQLQSAVAGLGEGLDWSSAAKRDLDALSQRYRDDPQTSATLSRISAAYLAAISDESKVSALDQALNRAPKDLANLIPSIRAILKQKQALSKMLRQTYSALQ